MHCRGRDLSDRHGRRIEHRKIAGRFPAASCSRDTQPRGSSPRLRRIGRPRHEHRLRGLHCKCAASKCPRLWGGRDRRARSAKTSRPARRRARPTIHFDNAAPSYNRQCATIRQSGRPAVRSRRTHRSGTDRRSSEPAARPPSARRAVRPAKCRLRSQTAAREHLTGKFGTSKTSMICSRESLMCAPCAALPARVWR